MKHLILLALSLTAIACGGNREEQPTTGQEQAPPPAEPANDEPAARCGGVGGLSCPAEHWCDMPEPMYPDAMGSCRPNGECDATADCERQTTAVHSECAGAWACRDGACAWDCS